jgi:hypothetical protein
MRFSFHSAALFACAVASVALMGCSGEEKTYTENLVRAARGAEVQETRQDLELIGTALERYAIDHGGYPEVSSVDEIGTLLTPTYLSRVPQEDGWRRPWRLTSGSQGFVLASDGPDGVPDTSDDLRRESGRRGAIPGL